MEHTGFVGSGQRLAQAHSDVHHLVARQRPGVGEAGREVHTLDQLHGQERRSFVLPDVMDAANAGVGDLPSEAHLLDQTPLVQRIRNVEDLESDGLAQHAVVGFVDLAHTAAPDHPLDAVAAGDDAPSLVAPLRLRAPTYPHRHLRRLRGFVVERE